MYGDGSDGALNVTSGTTNLSLDTKYQYTTVNVSAGAKLSTTGTSGSVLYICATTSINIDGIITLMNKIGYGQNSLSVTIDGVTYNNPSAGNGGNAGYGGTQNNGFGGGGRGGTVNSGNTGGATGGNGGASGGSGGAGGSGTTTSSGSSNGWGGGNGGTSAGGGGNASTSKSSSGDPNPSATAGSGGSAYGNNGGNGSTGSLGAWNRISAAGGGGAGGRAGRPGIHLVLKAPVVTINGQIFTGGTDGTNGGNGGNGVANWGSSTTQGGYYANGGHAGGGGGGGNGGNITIVTDNFSGNYNFDTRGGFNGSQGFGGSGHRSGASNGTDGNPGTMGINGTVSIINSTGEFHNGYKYRKKLSIDYTKVGSFVGYFRALVYHTDADLKSVANGGKVELDPCLDIRFEDTSGNQYPHEIVNYDPTTGAIEAWVRLGFDQVSTWVSNSVNTDFYIYFGKKLEPNRIGGIPFGFKSGEVSFRRNYDNTSNVENQGELGVFTRNMTDPWGNSVTQPDNTKFVAAAEDLGSLLDGYVMYTATSAYTRFGVSSAWNDYLVMVYYDQSNNTWYMDNNGASFNSFTPDPTDFIVGEASWGGSTGGGRSFNYVAPAKAGEERPWMVWSLQNGGTINVVGNDSRAVYHFNETPGSNSNDIRTISSDRFSLNSGAQSMTTAAGKFGNGVVFNGTNGKIRQPPDVIWSTLGTGYMSAWVYPSNLAANGAIFSRRSSTGSADQLTMFSLAGAIRCDSGGTQWSTGYTFPSANQWYFVVWEVNGTTWRLYVNGTQVATMNLADGFNGSTGYNRVQFGASASDASSDGNWFSGRISEFFLGVWARGAGHHLASYNNQNDPSTFYSIGALEVKLTPAETLHSHTVDSVTLSEHSQLTVNETLHGHTVDSVTTIQDFKMTVAETLHGHTADHIELQVPYPVPEDTLHTVTSDVLSLVEHKTIVVNDTTHIHTVDNIALDVRLVVESTIHQHTADETGITQEGQLGVQKSFHDVTSTNVVLFQSNRLKVQDASHTHTVDNVNIVQHLQITSVADSHHGHTVDGDLIIPIDYQLGVNATSHTLVSDNIAHLHEKYVVQVQEALHAHTADTLTITTGTSLENLEETRHVVNSDNIVLTQKHGLGIANAIHKVISGVVVRIIDWTKLQVFKGKYKNNGIDEGDFIAVIPEEGAKYKAGYRNSGELQVTSGETGAYKVGSSKNGNYF